MQKGFSTLFIVILLGSIALSFAIRISVSSFWAIQASRTTKENVQVQSLVNACAEIALERIRQINSYSGSGSENLDGNTCEYDVTHTGSSTRSIIVTGNVKSITRSLEIETDTFNPPIITSWTEL